MSTDSTPSVGLVRVLLIEDDPAITFWIADTLKRLTKPVYQLDCAECIVPGLRDLKADGYDAVLLDLNLPAARGIEAIDYVRAAAPCTPIVVISGRDEDKAMHEHGMQVFLNKSDMIQDPFLLPASISSAIAMKSCIANAQAAERISQEASSVILDILGLTRKPVKT
mgnify:CR=1 FL=1